MNIMCCCAWTAQQHMCLVHGYVTAGQPNALAVFFFFSFIKIKAKQKRNKIYLRITSTLTIFLECYIYSSLQKVRRGRPWRYDPVTIRNRFEKLGFSGICV